MIETNSSLLLCFGLYQLLWDISGSLAVNTLLSCAGQVMYSGLLEPLCRKKLLWLKLKLCKIVRVNLNSECMGLKMRPNIKILIKDHISLTALSKPIRKHMSIITHEHTLSGDCSTMFCVSVCAF